MVGLEEFASCGRITSMAKQSFDGDGGHVVPSLVVYMGFCAYSL